MCKKKHKNKHGNIRILMEKVKYTQIFNSIISTLNLNQCFIVLSQNLLESMISFTPWPNVILEYDTQCLLPSQ